VIWLKFTDVSEEHTASTFRVNELAIQEVSKNEVAGIASCFFLVI
jgi:hypothetical protein